MSKQPNIKLVILDGSPLPTSFLTLMLALINNEEVRIVDKKQFKDFNDIKSVIDLFGEYINVEYTYNKYKVSNILSVKLKLVEKEEVINLCKQYANNYTTGKLNFEKNEINYKTLKENFISSIQTKYNLNKYRIYDETHIPVIFCEYIKGNILINSIDISSEPDDESYGMYMREIIYDDIESGECRFRDTFFDLDLNCDLRKIICNQIYLRPNTALLKTLLENEYIKKGKTKVPKLDIYEFIERQHSMLPKNKRKSNNEINNEMYNCISELRKYYENENIDKELCIEKTKGEKTYTFSQELIDFVLRNSTI